MGCAEVLGCAGSRWVAEYLEMKNALPNVWFSHMELSKIGSDLANANCNVDGSANWNANATRSNFLHQFYKNMFSARARNTFLKSNSEQSAFNNSVFGALKASIGDSLGHLFTIYGFQTFFFAAFPLQSPIQILKICVQNVRFSHMEPSETGSNFANANFNANASANSNAHAIWSDLCLRLVCLNWFLPPFGSVFASFFDR